MPGVSSTVLDVSGLVLGLLLHVATAQGLEFGVLGLLGLRGLGFRV